LKNILNQPIFYERKGNVIQIPSITAIVHEFLKHTEQLPQIQKKYILHGDFEPINVVKNHKGEICFVDLSDLKFGEDPTWDIGKWVNHIRRLHRAVIIRGNDMPDPFIDWGSKDTIITIVDRSPEIDQLERVNQEAIKIFAEMIQVPVDVVLLRCAAAEFVVNLSTLKRHVKYFPQTTKSIVLAVVESYCDFDDKFKKYKNQEKKV
jgi:hypothetical protein